MHEAHYVQFTHKLEGSRPQEYYFLVVGMVEEVSTHNDKVIVQTKENGM